MVLQQNLKIDHEAIADFCRRNHIRRLSLFGSVLTDRFGPESDVDVLVEFEESRTPGFGFVRVQEELSELVGRPVDLLTFKSISKYIRDKVLASAEEIYGG